MSLSWGDRGASVLIGHWTSSKIFYRVRTGRRKRDSSATITQASGGQLGTLASDSALFDFVLVFLESCAIADERKYPNSHFRMGRQFVTVITNTQFQLNTNKSRKSWNSPWYTLICSSKDGNILFGLNMKLPICAPGLDT